jgi:hypothetical protein
MTNSRIEINDIPKKTQLFFVVFDLWHVSASCVPAFALLAGEPSLRVVVCMSVVSMVDGLVLL